MGSELAHDALAMVVYRDNPPACILGDSEGAVERMRQTAEAADCRILGNAGIGSNPDRIRAVAPDAIALIELAGSGAENDLVALLDWAQHEVVAGRRQVVISAPLALTDLVASRAWAAIHLCEASEPERVAWIASASRRTASQFYDIGRDDGPVILQQLSEDVGRIAAILASLSEEETAAMTADKSGQAGDREEPGFDAAYVRSLIRARRLRDQYFRDAMFADPAWDMLLDLMAARLEENRVAVSSLCIAAAVPATTALRWIKALTDRGLFIRAADPQDGRRVYIGLSDDAARSLAAYLRAVQRIAPAVI